jgi:hypothetical protein
MSSTTVHRLGGLLAVAIGVATAWWFILGPLAAARTGAPEVSYSLKAFVFVPFAVVFGLFFIVVGDKVPYRHVEKQMPTAAGWILFAVAAAASAACFLYFKQQFAALGYQ